MRVGERYRIPDEPPYPAELRGREGVIVRIDDAEGTAAVQAPDGSWATTVPLMQIASEGGE